MNLSAQQKRAVEYLGSPTLVIAGAGSGKTRTLTSKIAYLIERGFDPERILAITFTNKAAAEMKQRLVKMTGLPQARFPWVRTFHSACFRILKKHCELMGFKPPVQIYSEYQQQKLIQEILAELNFDKKHVPQIGAAISRAKNSGNPSNYFELKPKMSHIRLIDVYERYETGLKDRNAVDFDNILLLARDLLRDHEAVRGSYRDLFRFILVDEYQDSNNLQEELTRLLLGHENLFCVGDDWQAIYGFRGSNVNHFLSFEKNYPGARIFRLEENYRSPDEIVQAANSLIYFNADQMEKKCFSAARGGVIETHAFYNEDQEANWAARKIQALRDVGIPLDRIAVLYRTKFCSLAFEKAFRFNRVPYQMMGAKGFFERKEILDLNCYLTSAAFPRDDASFERVLNTPKRGIGPGMLKKMQDMRAEGMSLQDAVRMATGQKILSPKVHGALVALFDLLDEIRPLRPDDAIRLVVSRCDYMGYLKDYCKSDMEFTSREENIAQLIYTASGKETLVDYLEEASLVKEDREDDDAGFGVKLSTIHASKGLEYQSVFIVACEEDLFPHWKCKDSEAALQEERRLMYVAMTRAEKFLFVSHANFRRGQPSIKSRFLDELEESMGIETPSSTSVDW